MKRLDRLQAILILLQSRSLVRGADLADRFGVTVRTVYRDMLALGEAGVPLVSEAGLGYSLERGYTLAPVSLTAEEAGALVAAGKIVAAAAGPLFAARYAAALDKVRAVLGRDRKEFAENLEARTAPSAQPGPPATRGSDSRHAVHFEALQRALGEGRVLRLGYHTEGRPHPETRDVEPLGLSFEGGSWRFVAYCRLRRGFRLFRRDQIQSCTVLDERFNPSAYEIPSGLEAGRFPGSQFWRVVLSFPTGTATASLESPGLYGFRSKRPEGDRQVLEFELDSPVYLAPFLLPFGASVEVREPAQLRAEMARRAAELSQHYGSPPS